MAPRAQRDGSLRTEDARPPRRGATQHACLCHSHFSCKSSYNYFPCAAQVILLNLLRRAKTRGQIATAPSVPGAAAIPDFRG